MIRISPEDLAAHGTGETYELGHGGSNGSSTSEDDHGGEKDDAGPKATETGIGEWDAGDDTVPIPPRGWLLGNVFCRRVVSSLVASGGLGKTAVRVAQLLSLACGRSLTGEHVFCRCRVLIVSLEDDADELRRRVRAAMMRYGVTLEEVKGWLFLAAAGANGWKLAITENGAHVEGELKTRLVDTIKKRSIDIVSLDPFVKSHGVEENENNAIDFVANILSRIAAEYNCAVDAPHHVSKGPADAGNADRARGASAFKDAARLVYTLTPMTHDEAAIFGVNEQERRSLVRMDSAKVNIAPPAAEAKWFRLVGVRLDNGTEDYPAGDEVQTVEPWDPPDLWEGLSHALLNEILTAIENGLPDGSRYSDAGAATVRAAWRVVRRYAPAKAEKQAREIIKAWVKSGLLFAQEYDDPVRREEAMGLRVNNAKRPS